MVGLILHRVQGPVPVPGKRNQQGGNIAQLGLFKNYYAGSYNTFHNTSVKLCHTNLTTLTTNFSSNYGGQTPIWVYHGTCVAGWLPPVGHSRPHDTFSYNGTSAT